MIDASLLDALLVRLAYDRENGCFRWIDRGHPHVGKVAGRITTNGRRQISWQGPTIHVAQLVFYVEHGRLPVGDVDHRDRDKLNDRYWNLREATRSQNCINTAAKKTNKLGVRGITQRENGKFRAIVTCKGRRYDCGTFFTLEEAAEAYRYAALTLFGDYVPEMAG